MQGLQYQLTRLAALETVIANRFPIRLQDDRAVLVGFQHLGTGSKISLDDFVTLRFGTASGARR